MNAISSKNFNEVVAKLVLAPLLSCDTETTGLRPYQGSRLFSIIFADDKDEYYFNFQDYGDGSPFLDRRFLRPLQQIFDREKTIFMHNAKFDMHILYQEGLSVNCDVHDTEVSARLIYNEHLEYGLDACAKRDLGAEKDDRPRKWCLENDGAWEWERKPGKKTREKTIHMWKVPYEIIYPYGCKDARLTYDLGIKHLQIIKELDLTDPHLEKPSLMEVLNTEKKLTKVCFEMEKRGIKIDRKYCQEAIEYEVARYQEAEKRFQEETGEAFVNSGKKLAPIFEKLGYKIEYTDKGNPKVKDEWLARIDSPIAQIVRTYRDAHKRANTYFQGFLYYADQEDVIHPDMRQAGTKTGRFSYTDPNLQNLSSEEEGETPYPVRKAFIPRPGHLFVMIDYQQMELRMMLDYAGEKGLIQKILEGHDPHQATADMTGLTRSAAKTLSFGILYGMGLDKLAESLRITKAQAKKFREKYFDALTRVELLNHTAKEKAEKRGYLFNWFGRLFHYPDSRFAYKGINSIIQGGCADVVKKMMTTIAPGLPEWGVHMLVQIHDEIVYEVPYSSVNVMPLIKGGMEQIYPFKFIPLTCSASYSLKSLGEDKEGLPNVEEIRDAIQRADLPEVEGIAEYLGRENSAAKQTWDA